MKKRIRAKLEKKRMRATPEEREAREQGMVEAVKNGMSRTRAARLFHVNQYAVRHVMRKHGLPETSRESVDTEAVLEAMRGGMRVVEAMDKFGISWYILHGIIDRAGIEVRRGRPPLLMPDEAPVRRDDPQRLERLREQEKRMRYAVFVWAGGGSLEEAGRKLGGVTRERARQIIFQARTRWPEWVEEMAAMRKTLRERQRRAEREKRGYNLSFLRHKARKWLAETGCAQCRHCKLVFPLEEVRQSRGWCHRCNAEYASQQYWKNHEHRMEQAARWREKRRAEGLPPSYPLTGTQSEWVPFDEGAAGVRPTMLNTYAANGRVLFDDNGKPVMIQRRRKHKPLPEAKPLPGKGENQPYALPARSAAEEIENADT